MKQWYENAIIYQVYPRSFQDSDNDGLGDLQGLLDRLDYIKSLGVNTIWLNPVFTSPQVDNGYDVSNYFTVDPHFGTMATMDALIQRAHELDLHILLDFVLNHTSDQHPWFQDALKSPKSLFHDYYIWQDTPNGQVPNNWGSFFGGSVWEQVPAEPNTYYFHLFDKHMPDLNWANPEVRQAMIEVAKYWVEKGIDGLRLDAFIHIAKADLGQNFPTDQTGPVIAEPMYANLPNVVTYLQEFIDELRKINPDLFILGEGASADPALAALYTRTNRGSALCDAIVSFRNLPKQAVPAPKLTAAVKLPLAEQLDTAALPASIVQWQTALAQTTQPTLYFSNHDLPRMATVYADRKFESRSLKTLATMQYLQRGIPIIYYGEELGLHNAELARATAFQDQMTTTLIDQVPEAERPAVLQYLSGLHKTPARQAMPWDDSVHQGFSEHEPWLRTQPAPITVAAAEADPDSILNFYRKLFQLKQQPLFATGKFRLLLVKTAGLIVYQRQLGQKSALVLTNLTSETVTYQNDDWLNADITFTVGQVTLDENSWHLAPWSTLVLQQDQVAWPAE
ncbi:alpha-glucosidase [Lapidilactobacillus luobeiensis]|uniref:alpha-glucosidase n=1 Tax=Lapidilactobacillus luobeiensis TaxID=2950371 RepID=UPI0021C2DB9F|nr:alpha-glucosidase [Lapidilactobacillus luobeiensis]